MGSSKQRKAAFGVLSLAVAALVADKTFLGGDVGGPQPAGAAQQPPVTVAPAPAAEDKRVPRSKSFTECLKDYSARAGLEAGSTPDSFDQSPFVATGGSGVIEPDAAEKANQEFAASHALQLVLLCKDPALSAVTVNGRRLRIGDTLDGYTLEAIRMDADGNRWAGFISGSRRVALALQEPKLHGD